jgi:hypothetical protein
MFVPSLSWQNDAFYKIQMASQKVAFLYRAQKDWQRDPSATPLPPLPPATTPLGSPHPLLRFNTCFESTCFGCVFSEPVLANDDRTSEANGAKKAAVVVSLHPSTARAPAKTRVLC